jgi:protein SCO1
MNVRVLVALGLAWPWIVGGAAAGGEGPALAATSNESVYQLDGEFTDQSGRSLHLDVERGHPVLLSMFYASCRDACPLLLAELRRIDASLPPALRADVRVVLVSLDSARDTPAVLRELAASSRIDGTRWRLLTGTDDAVREVAAVLGVKFRRRANGMIEHSSVIAVLDRRGIIQSRTDGIRPGDPAMLARLSGALKRAARGADGPPPGR